MTHGNNYAVFDSDILLPVERVLKYYPEPFPLGERIMVRGACRFVG